MRNLQNVYVLTAPRYAQLGLSAKIGVATWSRADIPSAFAIHVKLRAEDPPLLYVRPLELLVASESPIMLRHGIGRVRAQVGAARAGTPSTERRGTFGVPAVRKTRIRLIRRLGVCGYECGNPKVEGTVVSSLGLPAQPKFQQWERMQRHSLTISAAPCHAPCSSTVSYRSRGPHTNCKEGFIIIFLSLSVRERSTGPSC